MVWKSQLHQLVGSSPCHESDPAQGRCSMLNKGGDHDCECCWQMTRERNDFDLSMTSFVSSPWISQCKKSKAIQAWVAYASRADGVMPAVLEQRPNASTSRDLDRNAPRRYNDWCHDLSVLLRARRGHHSRSGQKMATPPRMARKMVWPMSMSADWCW